MDSKKVDRQCQISFENAANQRDRLLARLRIEPVNTLMAREMGIMSPAARIMELRRMGVKIETGRCKVTSQVVAPVALYRLIDDTDGQ